MLPKKSTRNKVMAIVLGISDNSNLSVLLFYLLYILMILVVAFAFMVVYIAFNLVVMCFLDFNSIVIRM